MSDGLSDTVARTCRYCGITYWNIDGPHQCKGRDVEIENRKLKRLAAEMAEVLKEMVNHHGNPFCPICGSRPEHEYDCSLAAVPKKWEKMK